MLKDEKLVCDLKERFRYQNINGCFTKKTLIKPLNIFVILSLMKILLQKLNKK